MANILVVKVNVFCCDKDMDRISNYIRESVKTGVVILPPYCDAQVVPENIEVRVENACKAKGENHDC